jgi:predicted methyltransferase
LFYSDGALLLKTPLSTINGLTAAADRVPYYTSGSAAALATLTTFGRSLIDDTDAATARTTLGLGTAATSASTSFQSADATLTALAGVTTAADKLPYFTGTDTATVTDITTAGREILSTASSGTSGQVLTSSGGGAPTWTTVSSGSSTSTGYYGSFFDTTTQTHTSANTAKAMTINQTPPAAGTEANGVSIVSGSRITVANAGVYNIQFSAQLDNSDSQEHDADIWIALNGTAVDNSNTQITVPGSHGSTNGNEVAAWNFVLTLAAGDYIELMWSVQDVSISLPTYSAVSPHPATPSLIVTVSQVAVLGSSSPYAADSWTYSFSDPSGSVPTDWTVETGNTVTYPTVGTGSAIQLVSGATSKAGMVRTFTELTSSQTTWEIRVEMRASQVGSANESAIVIRDGSKRLGLYPTTVGVTLEAATCELQSGHVVNDWFIWTVRRAGNRIYIWSGPRLIHSTRYTDLTTDTTLANSVRLGCYQTNAVRTTQVRAFWAKFGSLNAAPPDFTFSSTYFGRS